MTILGILAVAHDHLVCWTDSEIFVAREPHGHEPKLVINAHAQVAMVGAGHSTLLRAADEPVLRGTTLDAIAAAVPAALRRRAGQVAHRLTACGQGWLGRQTVAVAGFSEEHRRSIAYTFAGANFFEPILATRLFVPMPADNDQAAPRDMHELIAFARCQLAALREDYPEASGGTLQVAELRPGSMSCTAVPDFDVDGAYPTISAREREHVREAER